MIVVYRLSCMELVVVDVSQPDDDDGTAVAVVAAVADTVAVVAARCY